MNVAVASVWCGGPGPKLPIVTGHWPDEKVGYLEPPGIGNIDVLRLDNRENLLSPCAAYQLLLEEVRQDRDVIIYVHDDVDINDLDWLTRISAQFAADDDCVAVGLGGATGLGNRDLYRTPYDIRNMARQHYASNQDDAEIHGERFTGVRQVAVLDAFCMAVRTEWLRSRGGWPVKHITHHAIDLWIACEAARDKKEIWMVGASVLHSGGGTSVKPIYANAPWLQGGSLENDHRLPHFWLYNEYRDVLPIEVGGNS